jgi:hypothetical protein
MNISCHPDQKEISGLVAEDLVQRCAIMRNGAQWCASTWNHAHCANAITRVLARILHHNISVIDIRSLRSRWQPARGGSARTPEVQ